MRDGTFSLKKEKEINKGMSAKKTKRCYQFHIYTATQWKQQIGFPHCFQWKSTYMHMLHCFWWSNNSNQNYWPAEKTFIVGLLLIYLSLYLLYIYINVNLYEKMHFAQSITWSYTCTSTVTAHSRNFLLRPMENIFSNIHFNSTMTSQIS